MVSKNKLHEFLHSDEEVTRRLSRTLYYGNDEDLDKPTLPLTELAVDLFKEHDPKTLGKVDMAWASMISRRACVSPCAMMLGMIYLERLRHKKLTYLRSVSSSDIYLISMLVASKYLYDNGTDEEVYNDEWAESANMEVCDINQLERQFLNALEWDLFVKPCHFNTLLTDIEKRIALREGLRRGYFTYSDLSTLCESNLLRNITKDFVADISTVILACSCAYVGGLLSLVIAPSVLHIAHCVTPLTLSLLPMTSSFNSADLHSWPYGIINEVTNKNSLSAISNDNNSVSDITLTNKYSCLIQDFYVNIIWPALLVLDSIRQRTISVYSSEHVSQQIILNVEKKVDTYELLDAELASSNKSCNTVENKHIHAMSSKTACQRHQMCNCDKCAKAIEQVKHTAELKNTEQSTTCNIYAHTQTTLPQINMDSFILSTWVPLPVS